MDRNEVGGKRRKRSRGRQGTKPIVQISPAVYLSRDSEPIPRWLKEHRAGERISFADVMKSRIVFNPGAGVEGGPIRIFNTAHAAHVFLWVDYGLTEEEADAALSEDAFRGYHLYDTQRLTVSKLSSRPYRCSLTAEELRWVREAYARMGISTDSGYCLLKIYERNKDMDNTHGAERFAVLYLGADAITAYDVLFGNGDVAPFACVVDAYGFSQTYDSFAKGSLLEKIAERTNRYPRYLVCAAHCEGWSGYTQRRDVGGSRERFLWIKSK